MPSWDLPPSLPKAPTGVAATTVLTTAKLPTAVEMQAQLLVVATFYQMMLAIEMYSQVHRSLWVDQLIW
jgi:hypothetical protein